MTLKELSPNWPSASYHTTLAAVDIAGFGDHRRRDEEIQLHLRDAMYELLNGAFIITQLPWRACHREDRGDGALIVTPPDVAAETLLDPLAHHLYAGLRRHNRLASEAARLQLRLAVHAGPIRRDANGITGQTAIHLFRLLSAAAVRKALAASGADLALVVSDGLHKEVSLRDGFIDPAAYRPLRITRKETRSRAWLWLPPGHALPARHELP